MKTKIVEIASAIAIAIIFCGSFLFAIRALSGEYLMQMAINSRIMIDQYSSTRAYVILAFSLMSTIASFAVLLYPVKEEIYSYLKKGISPLGFTIIEGKIRRKN